MKFLLVAINAKYIHSNPAIYSLKAYAGEHFAENIELAEYTINQYRRDILADIYLRKPDCIGFSCYIWNWEMIRSLIGEVHKVLPEAKLWLGGPEVTYDADKLLKCYPFLEGIMLGEGEETFRELLSYYVEHDMQEWNNRGISAIAGLCTKDGYTPKREPLNLSELPFLYDRLDDFQNKIIYYESSRGCPYRCSYCLSSVDKTVRFRDFSIVEKELDFFLFHRVKQVKFVDRTFNCNRDHTRKIWTYLLEHDNGVTNFHFEVSADIINEEELELLKKMRPGLVQLEIGVQSTNEKTLAAIDRHCSLERLKEVVARIKAMGNVHQHLDLIAGLPYEDYDSFKNSFNEVYAMQPEQLQLGFLKVLKGSPMERCAKEYGIVYSEEPPYEVLSTSWLSYDEVLWLKRIEDVVEIFYNSRQFENTMNWLVNKFESPFSMYEKLAEFFWKNEVLLHSPARAKRYEALLAFVKNVFSMEHVENICRELLVLDYYLRERPKNRPEFAVDEKGCESTAPQKELARELFWREAAEHSYLPGHKGLDGKQLSKQVELRVFHYIEIYLKKQPEVILHEEKMQQGQPVFFDYEKNRKMAVLYPVDM